MRRRRLSAGPVRRPLARPINDANVLASEHAARLLARVQLVEPHERVRVRQPYAVAPRQVALVRKARYVVREAAVKVVARIAVDVRQLCARSRQPDAIPSTRETLSLPGYAVGASLLFAGACRKVAQEKDLPNRSR